VRGPALKLQRHKMRDLVFKNLTNKNKSRRILLAKEIINEEGIFTKIQKHLIYDIHEVREGRTLETNPKNELYIIKEKNTKLKIESFFIKMKSSIYINTKQKIFIVNFLHSLKIDLSAVTVQN
jgi:hypothetical protein